MKFKSKLFKFGLLIIILKCFFYKLIAIKFEYLNAYFFMDTLKVLRLKWLFFI